MLSSVSQFQKLIWDQWNIRIIILFSLFLQIFLTVSASCRKRIRGGFFIFLVWLFYLLADWAAGYCIGLIANNQEQKATLTQNDYLMAFWGPFLLLHLGGPDTISAFSVEDNELWVRHLLGLIFQSVTTAYVFLLTVPRNPLWLPTILMFVAGLIKYAERTHALYIAAINNFRKSFLLEPDAGANYAKLMEEYYSRVVAELPAEIIMIPEADEMGKDGRRNQETGREKDDGVVSDIYETELVQKAFSFFCKFQGLVVDVIYSLKDGQDSGRYFKSQSAVKALMLIEVELHFMYEVFYTKASVIRRYWFWFWGKSVSLMSITATLVLFIKADRHGFDKLDVRVTYALLYGALFLDVMALFKRFFTDYTATLSDESLIDSDTARYQKVRTRIFKCLNEIFLSRFLRLGNLTWLQIQKGPYQGCHRLSTKFLILRRWSRSIAGYNLLSYCVNESVQRDPDNRCLKIWVYVQDLFYQRYKRSNIKDLLDQWRYESKNPFVKELWEYLFEKLKDKSAGAQDIEPIQRICSTRGEQVVQKASNSENLKPFVDPNEFAFDQSLLLWHIATTLCSTKDADNKGEDRRKRQISMLVSDYMLYLLVMQPNMMSAIAGVGQKSFLDTCEDAKSFFRRRSINAQEMLKKACDILKPVPTMQKPVGVKWDRCKSVLFDACRLAEALNELENSEKWDIIASVWVELLSYAACHCRPTGHVQLLGKGGELISFVWLLMAQLGLSTQFQINEARSRHIYFERRG